MEFYEECDEFLIYLKDKTSSLPHETINPGKFEKETGIFTRGAAFRFLEREKKFIYGNIREPYSIGIEPAGAVFISETSFVEEQNKKEELKNYDEDKREIDLRLGKFSIFTQKLTWANICITIIFTASLVLMSVMTCNREKARDHREEQKRLTDSLRQAETLLHDSLINTALRLYLHQDLENPKTVDTSVLHENPSKPKIEPTKH